jgi:hypothetical protein
MGKIKIPFKRIHGRMMRARYNNPALIEYYRAMSRTYISRRMNACGDWDKMAAYYVEFIRTLDRLNILDPKE